MKQRISALDLQILAEELKNELEGYRLSNIYNIAESNRQFLLKFNKPDSKLNAVVDCGLRIHLTEFNRPIPPTPSGFVVKLRKHLKSKRLTALRQVANDRILVLQFSDGLFYLVLEFFSAGNVILLDENKKILSLQRIVHEHENRVGEVYNMFDDSIFDTVSQSERQLSQKYKLETVKNWFEEAELKYNNDLTLLSATENSGKNKKLKVMSIHKLLLSNVPHLSSDLLSKSLKIAGINPSKSCLEFKENINGVLELVNSAVVEYNELLTREKTFGYILAKKNAYFNPEKNGSDLEYVYETFHPFRPFIEENNVSDSKIIEKEGLYNKTLDDFFSTIESSKYALKIQNQEIQAQQKIEAARNENQRKIQALRDVQTSNETKGNILIANADLVEEAKTAVLGLVEQQMDWNTIEKLIQSEQSKDNQIAKLIQLPLDLKSNKITILLSNSEEENSDTSSDDSSDDETSSDSSSEEEDSDNSDSDSDVSDFETEEGVEKSSKKGGSRKVSKLDKSKIPIIIDLSLSAYANASNYFNLKKTSAEKQKKVEKNIEKAMKNIEDKIGKQLKKKLKESHEVLKKIRKPYFFEKYFWFFSSEGFLVLLGRSGAENDQIFSKYIEDDDIYMSNSFDTHVWIKNPEGREVPPNTLMQAGIFCMASSPAWQKKIASSPWWCFAKEVTKFDVDNSVLPVGVFRVKNEKQKSLLPPAQLVMGLGFLWKVKTPDNEFEDEVEEVEREEEKEYSMNDTENGAVEPHDDNSNTQTEGGNTEEDELLVKDSSSEVTDIAESVDPNPVISESDATDMESVIEDFSEMKVKEQSKKNVRGKKGKLKKMQKKYADQDEDEKRLRLEALGTLKGMEKQKLREQEEKERQQIREHRKAKKAKQKEQQALKFTKNEKVNVDYAKFRNELKSTLTRDDEIVDVVPVFAPWPALLKYKYKVKIQPGNAKKTKTLSEILNYFKNREMDMTQTNKEMDWPGEHEHIKTMKEQDMVLLLSVDKLKATLPASKNSKTSKNGKTQKKKK
ncbi:hypothetical protein RNJ44_03669 [Nakaseomyces bracarensis]|uniref:Ribosome quality control complex subunit 2 n=1 Tax=Nakaseomyces bracarensis TaxID=273131 RepID=A0ABR4NXQ0_9SACH